MAVFLATLPILCVVQLIHFERVCFNVGDFGGFSQCFTAGLLKQDYRYHKLRKAFSGFYHTHADVVVESSVGYKIIRQQGISEPVFNGD